VREAAEKASIVLRGFARSALNSFYEK
jgi:hypothetical protein